MYFWYGGRMDLELSLEEEPIGEEWVPKWKEVIPSTGKYLGLDISEESTGVCVVLEGKRSVYNIHLEKVESPYVEVILRRKLKSRLLEIINGIKFDVIVIEDVFQGLNPSVTRLLYALNTAIDELILDGFIECSKFLRVSNKLWKSWLFTLDSKNAFKGLNDKLKIEKCLELVDIYEDGDGFQDRLDSTGMLVGYFLRGNKDDIFLVRKRVAWEDVCLSYEQDIDLAIEPIRGYDGIDKMYASETYWSRSKVCSYLTEYPEFVFVSSEPCSLGNFGASCGMPYIEGGGYLAFWINPSKLKKYVKK